VRGKKYVLMLTLTLLLGAIIPSVPPVKSESYETRLFVRESPPGSWIDGTSVSTYFYVTIDIESPSAWDDTANGIVGWEISVHVDPSVLEFRLSGIYGATGGYWLFDFAEWNEYTPAHTPYLLIEDLNKTTGDLTRAGELLLGYTTLGVGAGGSSGMTDGYGETYGLCRLRFTKLSSSAYALIDIFNAKWVDVNGDKHDFDVVDDGHYNDPGFTYLHSQSSLIDLSNPVTTSWHELYPGYSNISSLNGWVDNNDDVLSPCDYIMLNETWYHVEAVTVTLYTRVIVGEEEWNTTNSPSSESGAWTNPTYAYSSDTNYAETLVDLAEHVYGGYGFSIPGGATITKVEVGYEAFTAGGDGIGITCSWDGGSSWATVNWSGSLTKADPGAPTWVDFTGATTWTIDKLSNANFSSKAIYQDAAGGAKAVYLDWIPARVTYAAFVYEYMYIDYLGGFDFMDDTIADPNGTIWHEVYPVFSNIYNLTGLIDDDASGNITIGDYIDLKNSTGDTTTYQVSDIDTDIVISGPVAEPPEFPLGLAVEVGLIVAIAYVWWRSRRKTKTAKVTKQPKLAY